MDNELHAAIRGVIADARKCSLDNHGFLQYMENANIVRLIKCYDDYCKKHGKPRIR